ncbi:MAG: hypothetical protein KC589_07135 [Nanoarchaeota archaeon]|nr:hypothetical protein [Nanoarchaeota archaeon]
MRKSTKRRKRYARKQVRKKEKIRILKAILLYKKTKVKKKRASQQRPVTKAIPKIPKKWSANKSKKKLANATPTIITEVSLINPRPFIIFTLYSYKTRKILKRAKSFKYGAAATKGAEKTRVKRVSE